MKIKLLNSCKYSFKDLFIENIKSSNLITDSLEEELLQFYKLPLEERNKIVKKMCMNIGWYYEDIYKDNCVYTAFSPNILYL